MASTKEYHNFILGQLNSLEGISYRYMMGEYIIYFKGKIVGGIYDDRLLIKPVSSAVSFMGDNIIYQLPYEGGGKMIFVENVDDSNYLCGLFNAIYDDLPFPKPKKKKLI